MSTPSTCARCGAALSAPSIGVCPRCELSAALESPPPFTASPGAAPESALKHFGDYELLEELGHGGMGVVYKARHTQLNRIVALKLLLLGQFSSEVAMRRFQREAQAAAALRHPNIVALHDIGEVAGQPYFTMEYVEGRSLASLLRDGPLPARQAATYCRAIADAMCVAHAAGIIHRDLKPSNIVLDPFDQPRVTDFGLAKRFVGDDVRSLASQIGSEEAGERGSGAQATASSHPLASSLPHSPQGKDQSLVTSSATDITLTGQILGSPNYLAPELAAGKFRALSPASDLFSIGAMLYECLTGRPPFVAPTLQETLFLLRDSEPVPPRVLNPRLPRDLETICLKCLEKEPAQRYASAQELADELGRFLKDEPIHARPVGRAEKVWRWCRRQPVLAASFFLILILILIVIIGSPVATSRINQLRKAERAQLKRAEAGELKALQIAYASDMNLAHQAVQEDDFYRALQLLNRHRPRGQESEVRSQESAEKAQESASKRQQSLLTPDLRGWEWRYLWRQCQGEGHFILGEHSNGVSAVGMLADGKTVFSAGKDKAVRLWDLESRRQVGVLSHAEEVIGAAASPDGRWLATATRKYAEGQPVLLWDLATQTAATLTTNFSLRPGSITFSPDSKLLAFASVFGGSQIRPIRIWDVNARSEITNLSAIGGGESGPVGVAFSSDRRMMAYNENQYGAILLWDIASRSVTNRLVGHQGVVSAFAFSPDGQTLASGSHDRTARLWNVADGRERFRFSNRTRRSVLAFTPDGRTLAMLDAGTVIRLVDVESGGQKSELRGHLKDISSLAFTPDGERLLSGSDDGTLRVWDTIPRALAKSAHEFAQNSISMAWVNYGPALCLSPDGRHLLVVYTNQTFSLWDTLSLTEGERHPLPFTNTTFATVASGGRLAAFGSRRGELMLWDGETGQTQLCISSDTNNIHLLAFSLDGRYLAAGYDTKTLSQMAVGDITRSVRVWDVGNQKEAHVFSTEGGLPMSLTFSADAKALIAGFGRGSVKLWPLDGPGEAVTFIGHSGQVHGLAMLPDGQTLVSAAEDIRFWDVRTRQKNALKLSPRSDAHCIALSADGRRLAAGAGDGRITIWDMASHQEVATLKGHEESVTQLAFTPDGEHLVSASKDQLRIWHAASPSEADAAMKPSQQEKQP